MNKSVKILTWYMSTNKWFDKPLEKELVNEVTDVNNVNGIGDKNVFVFESHSVNDIDDINDKNVFLNP